MVGMIPGVGALYNAEYKKAAIQIVVFAGLNALQDGFGKGAISSFISYLLMGFWAYMVFDSWHTTRARKQGMDS